MVDKMYNLIFEGKMGNQYLEDEILWTLCAQQTHNELPFVDEGGGDISEGPDLSIGTSRKLDK